MPVKIDVNKGVINSKRAAKRLEKMLRQRLEPELRKGVNKRREFVQGWSSSSKPAFTMSIKATQDSIEARVLMGTPIADRSTEGKGVYHFINEGTKVRRVTLSSDWQSQTSVGTLDTRDRQGFVTSISKGHNFKGIEARGIEDLINSQASAEITKIINRVIEEGEWIKP